MPTSLNVEKQCFEFGERWMVAFKYDETVFYRKEAVMLQGDVAGIPQSAKAVDVIALHRTNGLFLLEVKDFRGHRIGNKSRIGDDLATEVAVKTRDTIAALVGASRKPVEEFPSGKVMAAMENGRDVSIVLWLEDDSFRDTLSAKARLSALNSKLKSKLTWLNAKTFAQSSSVFPNRIDDLNVTNLPGAGQPNP